MAATLTGPITLPDGTPMEGAQVKVRLVAGNARAMGHVNGNTVAGVARAVVDANGDFTLQVEALPDDDPNVAFPSGSYYEVEVGGGRWPKYTRKVKPEDDLTYQLGDPDIFGESEDMLPPEFVQAIPDFTTEVINTAVVEYFAANPIDVSDEVDAALALDPPLLVSENGADVVDDAAFRLNIGAASDSDISAAISTVQSSIDAINLAEATAPAVRAPGYASVTFAVVDGVVSFEVNGEAGGGGGGSFQPLDSDLTAIAALTTTSFGRALLTLANAAAMRTTIGPSGTADATTFLRGDGTWSTPAAGDVATDAIWDAAGDLAVGSGANTAAKLTKGSASTFLRVNSGGTALEWGTLADADVPAALARDSEVAAGYQPLDSDLTAIAALTTTSVGRSLLAAADAAALRTILALGTAATSATGDFQPIDSDLTAIAALTTTSVGRSLLAAADAAALRTILALGTAATSNTGDFQAADAELAALAGLTSAADRLPYFTGSGSASLATFTAAGRALVDDADASAQLTTLGVSTFAKTILDDADAATVRATIDLDVSGKGYVNHGATAGTARPSGYASVEWHGSVEPTNWVDGDTWVDA
jgi:hypothetical protein